METGQCICKDGYGGSRCDQCLPGFFKNPYLPFFQCQPCGCSDEGSTSEICDSEDGQCTCNENVSGRTCNECKTNLYGYPDCFGKSTIQLSVILMVSLFHFEFVGLLFSINLACGLTSEKGQVIQTFEKWGSIFKVEFDIRPNFDWHQVTSVLHLTTGEESRRIPAVLVRSNQFHISTTLDGNGNYWFNYEFEEGQKYHFVIEQTVEDGIVMYKIIVDGEVVHSKQNNNPQDFNNVMAYVSDPWRNPFDGCLENLELTPGNGNLEFKILHI